MWAYFFIGGLAQAVILGLITNYVAKTKGYHGGFLWGFFFSIVGLLVVGFRPNIDSPEKNDKAQKTIDRFIAQKNEFSLGKVIRHHFFSAFSMILLQFLVKAVCLTPIVLMLLDVRLTVRAQATLSNIVYGVLFALLFIFVVLPFRTFGFSRLCALFDPAYRAEKRYATLLEAGLRRFVPGFLSGVPFLFALVMLIYAYNGMSITVLFDILVQLGALVGGGYDTGLFLWIGFIVFFACVFAFVWWWGLPKDYVPLHTGVMRAFTRARAIRKKEKGKWYASMGVNILLSLPSFLACIGVLIGYYGEKLKPILAKDVMSMMSDVMTLLKEPLPLNVLLILAGILLLIHIPLCTVRKLRNAVLVRNVYHRYYEGRL